MMEIIVQVLPNMILKATEIINIKQTFLKNFPKTLKEFIISKYKIQMYKSQQKMHLLGLINEVNEESEAEIQVDYDEFLEVIRKIYTTWKLLITIKSLLKFGIFWKKIRNLNNCKSIKNVARECMNNFKKYLKLIRYKRNQKLNRKEQIMQKTISIYRFSQCFSVSRLFSSGNN
ncbi:unnamed protein product [Paramecium pentaurelia]|uniref:Uncharacterized protein n=1 Tax=Paramecium pentaurelia TaxID=43138 RepID=A0A8S1XWB7_9CILI|nr:unnamed protein product [Paramecium pentaurelia]